MKWDLRILANRQDEIRAEINKDLQYCTKAVPVKPGVYTCRSFSCRYQVFAHKVSGHKSESDFMVSDETMKRNGRTEGCGVPKT